ncbi:MAG: redoxin domain-containing protein [Ferruginibacter sp.]
MRKSLVTCWLVAIFASIFFLFWRNEWKYSLPTPIPSNYKIVETGTLMPVSRWINKEHSKPVFFHFFNPDCPCSRFNIAHFKTLMNNYSGKIDFYVVVVSKDKNYAEKDIREKYNLSIPVLFDLSIATYCGVYSTPQAVLIDKENKLYYRGNYNKSRYCTEKNSDYAKLAIDSLIQQQQNPTFPLTATKSYGCSLPGCSK